MNDATTTNTFMAQPIIVTFNVGSATMKMAAYDITQQAGTDPLAWTPVFDVNINLKTKHKVWHAMPPALADWEPKDTLTDTAVSLFTRVQQAFAARDIVCAHRVVHGGTRYHHPVIIDDAVMARLVELSPICPLHQPPALAVVTALRALDDRLRHIAAFDTAFHYHRPEIWASYALPKSLRDNGVRCYGFHGLSYQAILRKLDTLMPELAKKRLIIAHLGSGCSITAVEHGKSKDSTLGFSGLDGVPMGTRPGHLDAGVVLYLVEQGWTLDQMNQCLYKESGLLGLSGISNDVRDLLASHEPRAKFALEYFVSHAAKEIASLMVSMKGCDALIFTAGIGEQSAIIRQMIVDQLDFLGFSIDADKNIEGRMSSPIVRINSDNHKQIYVILTDEQLELALSYHQVKSLVAPI